MAQVLSFPFRLAANGTVVTVESTSDAGIAEQINAFIQTIQGERPLAPGYGINDPTFDSEFDPGMITAGLAEFCPEANVLGVRDSWRNNGSLDVIVEFERAQS